MRLSVVVPFHNELRALPTVIQRLLAVDFAALGVETELIFVDDGSTDAGRSLFDPLPRDDIQLIVYERNQGKGAAVRTGLEAATATSCASRTSTLGTTRPTCLCSSSRSSMGVRGRLRLTLQGQRRGAVLHTPGG